MSLVNLIRQSTTLHIDIVVLLRIIEHIQSNQEANLANIQTAKVYEMPMSI